MSARQVKVFDLGIEDGPAVVIHDACVIVIGTEFITLVDFFGRCAGEIVRNPKAPMEPHPIVPSGERYVRAPMEDRAAVLSTEQTPQNPNGYGVHLVSVGNNKINVLKTVKDVTGLDLKRAKKLTDLAGGTVIKDGLTKEEATRIEQEFKKAGATILISRGQEEASA